MKIWVEIGASLAYVISIIEIWKSWKNRHRIQVYSVDITPNQIILVLEKLGDKKDSLSPEIRVCGIDAINKMNISETIQIPISTNCELPCSERKTIEINHDLPGLGFLWFTTIIIYPRKSRSKKIRYRHVSHRLAMPRYYYELFNYKLFGKINSD